MVIGMGENKTPEPFRKACDKFTILENLLSEKGLEDGGEESHEVLGREKVEDAVIKMIMENQDNNKQTGLGEVGSDWSAFIRILTCEVTDIAAFPSFLRNLTEYSL